MPATVLGKRKSRTATKEEPPSISHEEALAVFQRHFEAQFKPLPAPAAKPEPGPEESLSDDHDDDDDDVDGASEDSWSGVSGAEDSDEDEDEIEVVSHTKNTPSAAADVSGLSKRELKALLSSRVPSVTTTTTTATSSSSSSSKRKPAADGEGDGEDAPSLLKNDLALQRLLTESHLFSKSGTSSSSSTATPNNNNNNTTTEHAGRNRHLANDLRLAALGSKRSVYAQARMPMGIRKGIAGAAAAREDKRRREARENGVVLERKSGAGVVPAAGDWLRGFGAKRKGGGGGGERRKKGGRGGGDRIAVDAPAVGRLRNGMLKLSRRDISEIQGSGGGGGMTRGKKRRR
ncbi:hypothetical protein DL770_001227 [Monosporascus sp. CRB-9-2]|nr:hypothetical protein DL770_001227 [Monosporascus sp. CRB-9-2]